MAAFKQLKKHAIVVYLDSKSANAIQHVSPLVYGALQTKESGALIPKAVVTTADQTGFLGLISYKKMGVTKNFSELNKQIRSGLDGVDIPKPANFEECWVSAGTNVFFRGNFVGLQDENQIIIKMSNGKQSLLKFDRVSPGSIAYARKLAGTNQQAAAVPVEREFENWTNTEGTTISGKFVSLVDGKITLEMEAKDPVTFDVNLLSAESTKRANELARQ